MRNLAGSHLWYSKYAMHMSKQITSFLLDTILKDTLPALVDDLRSCDWYVREHAVVNLFVFAHLLPALQAMGMHSTLIGIEVPVLQVEKSTPCRLGARKELVIWREPMTTLWKGCRVSYPIDSEYVRKHGRKPLAVVEWKNISRITDRPKDVEVAHESDVDWLRSNLRAGMFDVGYAIIVDQRLSTAFYFDVANVSTVALWKKQLTGLSTN